MKKQIQNLKKISINQKKNFSKSYLQNTGYYQMNEKNFLLFFVLMFE